MKGSAMSSTVEVAGKFSPVPQMTYHFKALGDGIQILFRFPNGAGVSVIRHSLSYGGSVGLWEAAPIMYHNDSFDEWQFIGLLFELPGFESDDVAGYLSVSDVDEIILMVASL
jgi:hypothetical protein